MLVNTAFLSRVSQRRGYNRIDNNLARSERYSQHES